MLGLSILVALAVHASGFFLQKAGTYMQARPYIRLGHLGTLQGYLQAPPKCTYKPPKWTYKLPKSTYKL